jgi:DNA-binding CsgD family transcriptional regulator
VGETLERVHAAEPDAFAADLAYHFHAAGDWNKAFEHGCRAGEMAKAMYAPHEGIEQFTRALEAAENIKAEAGRMKDESGTNHSPSFLARLLGLYHARGQAYETIGEFEKARADYEQALMTGRDAHDQKAEWQALIDLGFLWASRDYTRTGDYFREALALARAMNDPQTLAQTLNRVGNWHVNLDQPAPALELHTEALEIFRRLKDREGIAATLDLLGLTREIAGDMVAAATYLSESVSLARELGNQSGLVSSLTELSGLAEMYFNDTVVPPPGPRAQMISFAEEALSVADQIGSRPGEAYALGVLSALYGFHGEYGRALELGHKCLRVAEEIGHVQWKCLAHNMLGLVYLDLVLLGEAREQLLQGLAMAQQMGSSLFLHTVSGALARTYIAQNELERAEAVLAEALGPDPVTNFTFVRRGSIAAWGELVLARGDAARALEIADHLVASAANRNADAVIPRLWKLRGEAFAGLKAFEEAESALTGACTAAAARGLRPILWRLHRARGKLYQAQDRRKEADAEYSAARRIIHELAEGISDPDVRARFQEGTNALLPRPRGSTPLRAEKGRFGGLTAREREIAALVAGGKSNREIADTLVVSERTVAVHITSIHNKLGFNSRTQIAVWAVESGLAQPPTE